MEQPDPVPLSALLGRLGVGPYQQLDTQSQELKDKVQRRYNSLRELMDAIEHVSGVHDWDLQIQVVDAFNSQVGEFQREFHEYAQRRKTLDINEANAKGNQDPV